MKKDKYALIKRENRYLELINEVEDLIYFQSNRDYLIKNIELFQGVIMDGYANEKKIKGEEIKVYEFAIEAIRNLTQYLVESKNKYQKNLEMLELELNELKEEE